jgi:hypothetical protein
MQTVKLSPDESVQPSKNVNLDMALSVIRDILWRDIARATDVSISDEGGNLTIIIAGAGVTFGESGKPKFLAVALPQTAE